MGRSLISLFRFIAIRQIDLDSARRLSNSPIEARRSEMFLPYLYIAHTVAQLDQSLGAQYIYGDRELQSFVEFYRRCRMENDRDGSY